jgi:hypothetical protein
MSISQSILTRTLWEPEGFDPRDLGFWKAKDRKGIEVFISRILTSHVAADRGGWTPVRREEARAVLASWEPKRARMEQVGLIECDHRYERGVKAFHFRLGPEWRSRPIRHRKTDDPETLRLWLAIRGIRPEVVSEPADPIKDHLDSWLRRMALDRETIEKGMARVVGDQRRIYSGQIINLARFGDPADRDGDYCAYGRFHSLITRMPKWMREAIRIDGRPLGEADIRATQPLIQAIRASRVPTRSRRSTKSVSRDRANGASRSPIAATTPPAPAKPSGHRPHTIVSGNAPIPTVVPNLPPDLVEFFDQYATGVDFYIWFASKVGLPCATDAERGDVKKAWAWLVYDEPRWQIPAWRRMWEAYRAACPTIASWLERAKRDDYREAARECQRHEAELMIQGVVGQLLEHHPDLPVLTIHDAIMAPEDGLQTVCDVIRRVWRREGVIPQLKITHQAFASELFHPRVLGA